MVAYDYPGKEKMEELWKQFQPRLTAIGAEFNKFATNMSTGWTDGDAFDLIEFSKSQAPALEAVADAALKSYAEELRKNPLSAGQVRKADATVKQEARLVALRSQLTSSESKAHFDTLMTEDGLGRLLAKHSGEKGIKELQEEYRQRPELLAYGIAKVGGLGAGALDRMGDTWLASTKLWDKQNVSAPSFSPFSKFLDSTKDWKLFGLEVGSWIQAIRTGFNMFVTFIPNVVKTGYQIITGISGHNAEYDKALAEVKQEGMDARIKGALAKSGEISDSFAAELSGILRDPKAVDNLPPLPSTFRPDPKPAPAPAPEPSPRPSLVASKGGPARFDPASAERGAGVAATGKPASLVAPALVALTASSEPTTGFVLEHVKSANLWRDVVITMGAGAPFSLDLPNGKLRPGLDITAISFDPAAREINRYISNATAHADYSAAFQVGFDRSRMMENSIAAKRYDAYYDKLLPANRTENVNTTEAKTAAQVASVMQAEFDSFVPASNEPASFSSILGAKNVNINALDFPNSDPNLSIAKLMTVEEVAQNAKVAGVLAFRQFKKEGQDPEQLADQIVAALRDPQQQYKLKQAQLSGLFGQGNPKYVLSGELMPTDAERQEYAQWLIQNPTAVSDAYDRAIGPEVTKARTRLTYGEIQGFKKAMYEAAQAGTLDLDKLTPALRALYEDTNTPVNAKMDAFSTIRMLSNLDLETLDTGKIKFNTIQIPQWVADARHVATKADAQLYFTAVNEYGIFPGEAREVVDTMKTIQKNISAAKSPDAWAPGVDLPSADLSMTYLQPPQISMLLPEEQARGLLQRYASAAEQQRLDLLAQREAVTAEIAAGRLAMASTTSTAVGAATIAMAEVDPDAPLTPGTVMRTSKEPGGAQALSNFA